MTSSSEQRLRVGIDATTWRNDRGFGRFTRELVTALAARDAGIAYTLVFDGTPPERLPAGVDVVSARTRRSLEATVAGAGSRSPRYLWRVGRAARRAGVDVFFFPAVYSYFPLLSAIPCVVCYHDTTAERLPHLLFPTRLNHRLWQIKTALAKLQTTRAMTVSRTSAGDVERIIGIPSDRIDVVTEAPDPVFRQIDQPEATRHVARRHRIPETQDLLVYVGGMNRHKNVLGLLEAMVDVVSQRPATHLAIVGSVSSEGFWDNVPELRAFVDAHPPLSSHVHFTGWLEDADLALLLNGAAALVMPSLWEGFGLPAVEAMACGVPVLASNRGSLPEVVGDAGLFFDPEPPSAIAACVLRFLGTADLRTRMRSRARERAGAFTWSRAAELAEASFRRCLADSRRR